MTKPIRIITLSFLLLICGGCCETCGHTHHGPRATSSNGSVHIQPSDRVNTALLAVKHSIRAQEDAISKGEVQEFLDALKWMIRAMALTRTDIDSLPEAEQPAVVQKFMQTRDPIPSLYRSDRFHSFQQAASSQARREMDELIQQVQKMDLETRSSQMPGTD
jgi:hypothetical protein